MIRSGRFAVSRRGILKGLALGAGGALLSPVARALGAHAEGAAPAKRFVFVLQNNGLQEWAVQPKGIDPKVARITERPLDGCALPEDIDPLAPFLKRLTLVQGLHGRHVRPHHGGPYCLSGTLKGPRPAAETVDAALAKALPGVFPLVGLGINPGTPEMAVAYCSSAWGPNKPIPIQCRPDLAYETLFGSVGASKEDFRKGTNLLDFVKEDVRRLNSRLAGEEREKLDPYLDAFESLSRRRSRLASMEDVLKRHAPKKPADLELSTDVLNAQFDLAAAALVSGLTRVVTIASGLCATEGCYTGLTDVGVHPLGHSQNRPIYTKIRRFHVDLIAKLVRKLEGVPEGDGTMMDNTAILYTSDGGYTHHSDGDKWPWVIVGGAGGRLKTGRLVMYPGEGSADNRSINALFCTLLHAAGAPREHFNLDGPRKAVDRPGPLPELLA
jgi:hypothetical protein